VLKHGVQFKGDRIEM